MNNFNFISTPFANADAYKISHFQLHKSDTTGIYSNLTPSRSMRPGIDKFVFFGLHAFLIDFNDHFNNNFFNLPEDEAVDKFDKFMTGFMGKTNPDSNDKVRSLHKLGYLPLKMKALLEGSVVNYNIPVATFISTHEDFSWLEQWMETWLSCSVWKVSTSATTASTQPGDLPPPPTRHGIG